jgi:putative membrane protein
MKYLLALAGMSLAFAACAAETKMAAPAAVAGGDMTPNDRVGYVQLAAASDLFEIQSSNLALSRAQGPAVRQFAQMMIDHHTQTTAQLTSAASAAGTPPTPALMPMQVQMLNQLQSASAPEFDRLYMRQQIGAHEMALALHSNYAREGDTNSLKAVAAAAVPIVRQHLDRARTLG